MKIEVPIEKLRERSIFLATPMYGGQCHGVFSRSVADLSAKCIQHGIQLRLYFLFNESLITRARAYCSDEFMRSGCTHLMFIDSDIGFDADDVLMMLALQSDDSPYDVLCGPYPKKNISWEKIKVAVEKGFAENNPNDLEKYVGDYVFNPKTNKASVPLNEPIEILEGGTGFMMIRRKTFEMFDKAYPEKSYRPDHVRTDQFDGTREIMMYFDCEIDPDSKRYLSEDYLFCQRVWKMNGKVWMLPWIKLQHMGSYVFGGSLIDIAQVGVSPTADVSMLKKTKSG